MTNRNKTVDFHSGKVTEVSIEAASDEDISNTIAVMGGEDWEMWIDALNEAGVLADNLVTLAYSYTGPTITEPIYRKGTIGRAKDHLEETAYKITEKLASKGGKAYVSVNKALVTQASAAIPVIPLYISILFKVMKEKGLHEGCIEQMQRLYADRLFTGSSIPTDEKGRIRIDDWEMRQQYQDEIAELWKSISTETLTNNGDLEEYRNGFLNLFGFGFKEIDYTKDTNEMVMIPSIK